MNRLFNFCAGPATLPQEVLVQVQSELLNWNSQGASLMEISHRSNAFMAMAEKSEQDLRDLLNIPKNYKVLFLQGGAYGQFSCVPLNILGDSKEIDMIETGVWSAKAAQCAENYAKVNIIASTKSTNYTSLPNFDNVRLSKGSGYIHYCSNETINGVEFSDVPSLDTQGKPLVADMSSHILSRSIDVSKFGVIYAGAQKNIGPSGMVLAIVRDDLLNKFHSHTPDAFNYTLQAQNNSMLNTPPTFAWYIVGLVFEWLKKNGGVQTIEAINIQKANLLYNAIDESSLYCNSVEINSRSRMNVPFILKDASLNIRFIDEAKQAGLINLEGHRSVGGMRASIYNAMSLKGVQALVDFMGYFESKS